MNKKNSLVLAAVLFLFAGCLHMPARHDFGHYSDAEKFYADGKYEKAIDSYRKYINDQPEGNLAIIAKYYIAKSQTALKRNDEAKTGFQSIVQQYPDLIWAELSKEQLKNLEESAQ